MALNPKTVREHIVSLYGHITGLKKDIVIIKNNHLKHMHEDLDKVHNKIDRLLYVIIGGLGAAVAILIGFLH